MFFKEKILNLVVSQRRKNKKRDKVYFSRRFFHSPHNPIMDLDTSNLLAIEKIQQIKPGAVIDVGANIGKTLNNVLFIDDKIKYVGFEPQPFAAAMIQIFINDNNLKDKIIFPIGLSNKFSVMEFYSFGDDFSNFYNPAATSDKSFVDTHKEKCLMRKIVLENGDKLLSRLEIDEISAIKIDVEGAEIKVIEGLKDTISSKRPFLIFEMLPFLTRNLKEDEFFDKCKSLIKLIRSFNMTVFSIMHSDITCTITGIILFEDKDLNLKNNVTDYIAVPNEMLGDFNKILEEEF